MYQAKRVCVIGAGPSGMSVLHHFHQLRTQGKEIPEIVCFDKQSDWGGLWKYSWQTGEGFFTVCFLFQTFRFPTYSWQVKIEQSSNYDFRKNRKKGTTLQRSVNGLTKD